MKTIEFLPADEVVEALLDKPKPAMNYIPQYWKEAERFAGGKLSLKEGYNAALKSCSPFLDTFLTGYIIELWQDVMVSRDEFGNYNFDSADYTLGHPVQPQDPKFIKTLPRPKGFSDNLYTWTLPWAIRTPAGYSTIYTQPFNRYDLPFITTSGIVDTDGLSLAGNLPFFIQEGFQGIIEKGTPIAQVIPFKRENWDSKKAEFNEVETIKNKWLVRSSFSGVYKKKFWHRKNFK
jgi:hypothetical protein